MRYNLASKANSIFQKFLESPLFLDALTKFLTNYNSPINASEIISIIFKKMENYVHPTIIISDFYISDKAFSAESSSLTDYFSN